jgi:hypothetical protein
MVENSFCLRALAVSQYHPLWLIELHTEIIFGVVEADVLDHFAQ